MLHNKGIQRICGNIYGCAEAARFLQAKKLSLHKDRCGACEQESTYPHFMQHGLILSCRMCTYLSEAQGRSSGNGLNNGLNDCFQRLGRHCPICAFEYASLTEKEAAWIEEAGKVVRCFLGGASKNELAEAFFGLLPLMGCIPLGRYLSEALALVEEKKRLALAQRVREASKILRIDLLPSPYVIRS